MSQNPKPFGFPDIRRRVNSQGVGLDETADSLGLDEWVQVPFATNFQNYDTTQYGPCMYTKDRLGFVHLRGLFYCTAAAAPAVSTVIFNLPKGFWPAREEIFMVYSGIGVVRVDAMQDGSFQWVFVHIGTYTANNYYNLAGVHWHAPPQ
jgi:hypothetical protein